VFLVQETVLERRIMGATVMNMSYGLGFLLLPLFASIIRHWRWLLRLVGIAFWVLLPFHWLWVVKRLM